MTLTQVAILTKQLILLTSILLFISISGFVGYNIWHAYYLSTIPPVEEKPDTKFGILPAPDFPISNVSSSNFTYSLDTITGSLPRLDEDPNFPKIIKVYFITRPYASLLSSERIQEMATKFAITTEPQILNDTQYKFIQERKTLEVDLDSSNFSYVNKATVSASEKLDTDNQLVTNFKTALKALGVLKEGLGNGRTKVVLLKTDAENLVPTQLRTEAQYAQISLWPQPLDNRHLFTPNFNKALVNGIISNSSLELENYLSLQFIYWPIDTTVFATYPTKNPTDAFNNLQSGRGTVIIEPNKPQVSITSFYLGYYLSENYTPYLQPIYIFEGPQFVAYVPAVDKTFVSE